MRLVKKMHCAGFALADPPGLCAGICSALDAHRSFIVRAASAIGTQTLTNTAWTTPFRVMAVCITALANQWMFDAGSLTSPRHGNIDALCWNKLEPSWNY